MSDDEGASAVKRRKTVQYGSLEDQVQMSGKDAIDIGVKAGNINVTNQSKRTWQPWASAEGLVGGTGRLSSMDIAFLEV